MKHYYSYEAFKNDTKLLLHSFEAFEVDAIVGIARGGLTLSHAVAEALDIRDVEIIRTELYDKNRKRDDVTLFGTCKFETAKKVLVLDDIADSGETLMYVMKHLEEAFPEIEFKSATLFYKKSSLCEPDFWVNEATCWVEFFWEKDFSTF